MSLFSLYSQIDLVGKDFWKFPWNCSIVLLEVSFQRDEKLTWSIGCHISTLKEPFTRISQISHSLFASLRVMALKLIFGMTLSGRINFSTFYMLISFAYWVLGVQWVLWSLNNLYHPLHRSSTFNVISEI